MKYLLTPLLLVFLVVCIANPTEARTKPHARRSTASTTPALSGKLAPAFTNAAGDVTIAPPLKWTTYQSESWNKDAEGIESYTEDVQISATGNNSAFIDIYAEDMKDTTWDDVQDQLDGYLYEKDYLIAQGTTTLGMDTGRYLEMKDGYSHDKYIVLLKNGWKYTIHAYSQAKDWKRSVGTINASLSTLRINKVQ